MGALTIKPLAFKTRSWELSYTNYPNFFDNNFGLITIQKRGNEIIRILPSRHDNFFWITNKTRFFFETLKIKRLAFPFLKIKSDIVKIKWKKIIQFLQYLRIIQNLHYRFLDIPRFFEYNNFGSINYYNNSYYSLDFLSNFLFKKFFSFNNSVVYRENKNSYIGNLAYNYLNLENININKINVYNNINIVNQFPRLWSLLKGNNLNYYIGTKKSLNVFLLQISNRFTSLFNKEILILLKEKIQMYTEDKLNLNFPQIILKTNSQLYTTLWFDIKKNYGLLNKESFYLHFNTNNDNSNKKGIHFNFQHYGNMPKTQYSFFLPISTILEEKKVLLDGFGNLQNLNIVIARKLHVRSLIQLCWIFSLVLNIYKKRNYRYKKKIKQIHLKNYNLLEHIILLFFGRLDLKFQNQIDLTNILFKKIPNVLDKKLLLENNNLFEINTINNNY